MTSISLKRMVSAAAITLAAVANSAFAADVGVSVTVGQPGFYGRIDIGNYYPRPLLIYPQPIIVHRPVGVVYQPIYLHVPPGHAKKWRNYCGHYNACGRPVYFVQERWYNDVYVPRYRERHGGGRDDGHHRGDDHGHGNKGHDKGHGNGHGRD